MTLENYKNQIGTAIKQARLSRKLTQREVAYLIDLSQSRYSEIENGKGSFTAEQMVVLMAKFNLSISDIIKLSSKEKMLERQKSLAYYGADYLLEDEEIPPTRKRQNLTDFIRDILMGIDMTGREIAALAPIIVKDIDEINFYKLQSEFVGTGLKGRVPWLFENTIQAIEIEQQNDKLSNESKKILLWATPKLKAFLDAFEKSITLTDKDPEDSFSSKISEKTWHDLEKERTEISKKWKIMSRLSPLDFSKAIEESLK